MNRILKVLALSACIILTGAPMLSASAAERAPAPHATTVAPAPMAIPGASNDSASYDEAKAEFKQVIEAFTSAVNSDKMSKLTGVLQSKVEQLGKLEQDYLAAKSQDSGNQAKLDEIIQNYSNTVQSIETVIAQLMQTEKQMETAVNAGLAALAQLDAQKASTDKDLETMVAGLQKALGDKLEGPLSKAVPVVQPLSESVQRAVQARMQALLQDELKRAISNQLESKASQ